MGVILSGSVLGEFNGQGYCDLVIRYVCAGDVCREAGQCAGAGVVIDVCDEPACAVVGDDGVSGGSHGWSCPLR